MRGRTLILAVLAGALALTSSGAAQAGARPEYGNVADTVTLPATFEEATSLGRDMDRDGARDNSLGHLFAGFAELGQLDLAGAQAGAIESGGIVMLHSLRTRTLGTTKDATWQVWYGAPTPDPDLTGSGTFTLDPAQPHSRRLAATITDHRVKVALGEIPVRLDLGAGAFQIDLLKARVTATCFRRGCFAGRLTGAMTAEDVDVLLVPRLAEVVQQAIAADCPGPGPESCASGSSGAHLQDTFDADDDLVVTSEEVRDHDLVQSLLAPDLDLIGADGVMDSHSVGFGFTTVRATLVRP